MQSEEQKLLPCPFCGGEPLTMQDGTVVMIGGWIECRRCGARSIDSARVLTAVAAWNRRAPSPDGSVNPESMSEGA